VDTKTEFLPEGISDHTPMTISFQEFRSTNKFGHCDMWSKHPNYHDVVEKAVHMEVHGCKLYHLMKIQSALKKPLRKLNRRHSSMIHQRREIIKIKLEQAQNQFTGTTLEW